MGKLYKSIGVIISMILLLISVNACENNNAESKNSITHLLKNKNPNQPLLLIDSVFEYGNRYFDENYERFVYQVPMRDEVKLNTVVYVPKDKKQDYPIMFLRTPYSIELSDEMYRYRQYKFGLSHTFFEEKFIFVYQDVRGRFMSEGNYVNMRPQLTNYKNNKDIDESTDTYDTIEWLIKNISGNNGKVGMWGISYPGFYAIAGAINAHPALKAVSPQAPIADWFWDDFHHNGAFFLNSAFEFFAIFGIQKEELTAEWPDPLVEITNPDGYDFYLNELGLVKNIQNNFYKGRIAFWNEFIEHPNYDQYWQERSIIPHLKNIKPAVLTVGGLFDAEDLYGPPKIFAAIEKNCPEKEDNYLVLGPWAHGGWARTYGTELGNVYFSENPVPSTFYQENIELPFFKHYLKGTENPDLPKALVFETGTNTWKGFDVWPPENVEHKALYFHKDQKLSFDKPLDSGENGYDEYISDPANPVPFTGYPALEAPKKYMTDNQSFASERTDVLSYQTVILNEDITLAGNVIVNLDVSISASDADWIVKIIDVYPDNIEEEIDFYKGKNMGGYLQMVRSEVMRGRFRNSFEHPEPFTPNGGNQRRWWSNQSRWCWI